MIPKLSIRAAALAAAVALTAAACGSSSTASSLGPGFDQASSRILSPVDKPGGGTVNIVTSAANLDSLDPGQTYSAPTWNFYRAFGRPMMAFKHAPGPEGTKLVGDLATGPGQASKDGLTWTYTLRDGATYENGQSIKAQDVAWAIERSGWSQALAGSPTYFYNILTPPKTKAGAKYGSWDVYKNGPLGPDVIETPNDHTIVFHLPKPFGEFDYVMSTPATMPVPFQIDAKDQGASYAKKPLASGAYKIGVWSPGKELKLVKNEAYNAKSDPEGLHVANADALDLQIGVDAAERDQRLLDGQADVDLGSALTVANHAKVLSDPTLKSQVDDSTDGSLVYGAINTGVVTDVNCRRAIEFGIDKDAVLNELGGPYGGTKATNLVPDAIPGHSSFDLYPYNVSEAKAALAKCKAESPGDFDPVTGHYKFVLATQTNSPDLQNAATAIQASLKDVGIDADVLLYPFAAYSTQYCGNPQFANHHRLGLCLGIWGADWPTGYGFLDQLITSHGIVEGGGGSNWSHYSSQTVDDLEAQALATTDEAAQQKLWAQIDHQVMSDAAVVPLVQRKVLRFRSSWLTNVMIDTAAGGAIDLPVLGVK